MVYLFLIFSEFWASVIIYHHWRVAKGDILKKNDVLAPLYTLHKGVSCKSSQQNNHHILTKKKEPQFFLKTKRKCSEKYKPVNSTMYFIHLQPEQQAVWYRDACITEDSTEGSRASNSLSPLFPQPSSESASCSTSGLSGGPIISDVTDMSQASIALQLQPEESRSVK